MRWSARTSPSSARAAPPPHGRWLRSGATWTPPSCCDWLSVAQRHNVAPRAGDATNATPWTLDGLVLLDLPDFYSRGRRAPGRVRACVGARRRVRVGHRPQKYAYVRLHDDYLRVLATHAAVRRGPDQADRLPDRGHRPDPQRPRPARRGRRHPRRPGHHHLSHQRRRGRPPPHVARHRGGGPERCPAPPAGRRVGQSGTPRGGVAPTEATRPRSSSSSLSTPSPGGRHPHRGAAVQRDYRNQAWGPTGGLHPLAAGPRPDPMKRLRLNTRDAVEEKLAVTAGDVRTALGRSAASLRRLPQPASRWSCPPGGGGTRAR